MCFPPAPEKDHAYGGAERRQPYGGQGPHRDARAQEQQQSDRCPDHLRQTQGEPHDRPRSQASRLSW
jgi:hypothetical protein